MDPMDNELKIKLAEGPLGREGFTDGLRQRIEARIEEEGSRPKPRKTGFVAACALLAVTVMLLFVDGERLSSLLRINQSTYDEHSQHAAAPVKESWEASIRSALLLGLRTDLPAAGSQGEYSTYRTVLIAPEHNRLQKNRRRRRHSYALQNGLLENRGPADSQRGERGLDHYRIQSGGQSGIRG